MLGSAVWSWQLENDTSVTHSTQGVGRHTYRRSTFSSPSNIPDGKAVMLFSATDLVIFTQHGISGEA